MSCSMFAASTPASRLVKASVVDPNTLNLDPDPELWPNLDPDSDPGLPILKGKY